VTDVDGWYDHGDGGDQDYGDWETPEEYEAAQLRAEEPPDWYLEEEGRRAYERHCRDEHFGEQCICPPYESPACRRLLRLPRWSPRLGWHCGTPGGCHISGYRAPLAARRGHRSLHEPPF